MKAFGRPFAITLAALAASLGASAASAAASGYPSFCAIPPTPTGVRSPPAFKAAVVQVRLAGRDLGRRTAPATWSLYDTDAFAEQARAEAAPPPPIPGDDIEAAAFAAAARAAVKPPRR